MEFGAEHSSYDWDEIFSYIGLDREGTDVLYAWKSDMSEPNFAGIVKAYDGWLYAYEGWHDYTGWDCQSNVERFGPFETKEQAVMLLSLEARRALGFVPYPEYKNLWTDENG